MGRERVGACRQRLRFATSGATLALGVFIVVMLVAAAVISSVSHHFRLSSLGQVALIDRIVSRTVTDAIISRLLIGVYGVWHCCLPRCCRGVDGARMKSGNPQCRTPSVNKPGTTLVGKRT
jgi:hypothetical protein